MWGPGFLGVDVRLGIGWIGDEVEERFFTVCLYHYVMFGFELCKYSIY